MDLNKCPLTNDEKRHMVEEAAYFKAKQHDVSASPEADWLAAEAEIEDAISANCRSPEKVQDFSVYRWIRKKEPWNSDGTRMRQLGAYIPEAIDKTSQSVKKHVSAGIQTLGNNWHNLRAKQSGLLANLRDTGVRTLNRKSRLFHDWVNQRRRKDDS